jgi:hypothetical protein
MTDPMMTDLIPGRALDEKVARLVWPDRVPDWMIEGVIQEIVMRYWNGPPVSTDPLAALGVLEELAGRGWGWTAVRYRWPITSDMAYNVGLVPPRSRAENADGTTFPLAVCAAVLAAYPGE